MKAFIAGVVITLLGLACTIFTVSHFGLYPIGADNPPTGLERSLAGSAGLRLRSYFAGTFNVAT